MVFECLFEVDVTRTGRENKMKLPIVCVQTCTVIIATIRISFVLALVFFLFSPRLAIFNEPERTACSCMNVTQA